MIKRRSLPAAQNIVFMPAIENALNGRIFFNSFRRPGTKTCFDNRSHPINRWLPNDTETNEKQLRNA